MEIKYYPDKIFGYHKVEGFLTLEFEDGDRNIEVRIDGLEAEKLLEQMKKELHKSKGT